MIVYWKEINFSAAKFLAGAVCFFWREKILVTPFEPNRLSKSSLLRCILSGATHEIDVIFFIVSILIFIWVSWAKILYVVTVIPQLVYGYKINSWN